jgi:hypothetical protein
MDDEFLNAIDKTADPSFDVSAPTNCTDDPTTCPVVLNLLAKPRFLTRRSGSTKTGFLDGEYKSTGREVRPMYLGPSSGRAGTDDEKRGAYHLYAEYLAVRLGKNDEENSRLWNTALWIGKHYRVTTTPAEALPPLNIYVGDNLSQGTEGTGAPTGPDDEAPDESESEGVEFEGINVGKADSESDRKAKWWKRLPDGSVRVTDSDGITHRLDIQANDYDLLRLVDALEEMDKLAKIDVNDLMRDGPPILPQVDFPSSDQRVESGKIIRMLMLGMRSLWHPVIRAIADHATMKSLGQGNGKDVAAAVGRQRVIEGLRLAESIRKGLGRQDRDFSMWLNQIRARHTIVHRPGFSVDDIIRGTLAVLAGSSYLNQVDFNPLASNDNCRAADIVSKAA